MTKPTSFDNERSERIRRAIRDAVDKVQVEESNSARRTGPAAPGDLFLFDLPSPINMHWAVIQTDPDNASLLFAIPSDTFSFVGTADIWIPEAAACGPLCLRCGYGLWVHRDEFRPELRVGYMEDRYVNLAQMKLAEMAAGQVTGTAFQRETDANPEYDAWMEEVAQVVETLAESLRVQEIDVSVIQFRHDPVRLAVTREDSEHVREPRYALAAASAGLAADLREILKTKPEQTPPWRLVEYNYPGTILLMQEEVGIAVVFAPSGGQGPPELHMIDPAGKQELATWTPSPGHKSSCVLVPWNADRVVLQFGRGEHAKKVTVRKC